jgi:hypothetical protein
MSSLLDAVFIQVIDRTGLLMLNLSGTPYILASENTYTTRISLRVVSITIPL